MKTIGIATSEDYPGLTLSEQFLLDELPRYSLNAEPVVWSSNEVGWGKYDGILIRSIWDYHKRYTEFVTWLRQLKDMGVVTQNPPDMLLENADKTYLKKLSAAGVTTVSTAYLSSGSIAEIRQTMLSNAWESAVLKPTISATAYQTHLIRSIGEIDRVKLDPEVKYMLQPFISDIESAGEWSLIFFNGEFSHAVLKKPRPDDFRVQADFGGSFEIKAAPPWIIRQAYSSILTQEGKPLYARVDGVVVGEEFVLMELELIEPELFLVSQSIQNTFVRSIIDAFS